MILFTTAIVSFFFLPMPWPIFLMIFALVFQVAEYWGWKWFLRRYKIRSGPEAMIGQRAEVVYDCDPDGRVRLQGELWNARCAVPVMAGARVTVRALDGLTLEVEPETEPSG